MSNFFRHHLRYHVFYHRNKKQLEKRKKIEKNRFRVVDHTCLLVGVVSYHPGGGDLPPRVVLWNALTTPGVSRVVDHPESTTPGGVVWYLGTGP